MGFGKEYSCLYYLNLNILYLRIRYFEGYLLYLIIDILVYKECDLYFYRILFF